jgi:hypothetical protein
MGYGPFSTYLDPIKFANSWMGFTLRGIRSPGTIPKGGVRGFKRETGWDEKKGKGTQGATLTLKSAPPVKGSITLQFFRTEDFDDWDKFVTNVLSISPAKQQAEGLSIYYPGFAGIGLTTVVVKHYGAPEHVGRGLYHVDIEFIEWQPPPPINITSTATATATDVPEIQPTPIVIDPRITALQDQIALLYPLANPGEPKPVVLTPLP